MVTFPCGKRLDQSLRCKYTKNLLPFQKKEKVDYLKLEQFVSTPRLDRYLVSCANSQIRAKNLYGPNFDLKRHVQKAETNVRGTITPGKIISEQTFGFWTSLFEPRHYRLISGRVMSCFPNKPSSIDRVDIAKSLKAIREFRNRIYHNEAICFNNITIDFAHAQYIKTAIYELLDWMDSDLSAYVVTFDEVDIKIANALTI